MFFCGGFKNFISIKISSLKGFQASQASQQSFHSLNSFQESNDKNLTIISPASTRKITGTIVWLHGTSQDFNFFHDLWFIGLKPKYNRLVLPKAPFVGGTNEKIKSSEQEKRTWYQATPPISLLKEPYNLSKRTEDKKTILHSMNYLKQLMDNELKYVSSEYIILGGSGNGGALALLFGLQYQQSLSGIVVAHSYCPQLILNKEIQIPEHNKSVPILALHGEKNKHIPVSYATYCYNMLKELGLQNVEYEIDSNGAENFTDQQIDSLSAFFGNGSLIFQSSQAEMRQWAQKKMEG